MYRAKNLLLFRLLFIYSLVLTAGCGTGFSLGGRTVEAPSQQFFQAGRLGGRARKVRIHRNHAYILKDCQGIEIISLLDVSAVPVARLNTPRCALDIVFTNEHAVVAAKESLSVLDVTIPSQPKLIQQVTESVPVSWDTIATSSDVVAAGLATQGVRLYDFTAPSEPVHVASLAPAGLIHSLAIQNTTLFVGAGLSVYSYDISDKAHPLLLGTLALGGNAHPLSLLAAGNTLYVSAGPVGLIVVDIATPGTMSKLATLNTLGSLKEVSLSGNFLYGADMQNGLLVLDISNRNIPSLAATVPSADNSSSISIEADGLFVADGSAGLVRYKRQSATDLRLQNVVETFDSPAGIAIDKQNLWTCDRAGVLARLKLQPRGSAAPSPTFLSSVVVDVMPNGFALQAPYAYVTGDQEALTIVDTRTMTTAGKLNLVPLDSSGTKRGVWLEGTRAYIGYAAPNYSFSGFLVVDISAPNRPVVLDRIAVVGSAPRTIRKQGNYLFTASGAGGLNVFSASNPDRPVLIGQWDDSGYGSWAKGQQTHYRNNGDSVGLWLTGTRAYLANGKTGVVELDISDVKAPRFLRSFATDSPAEDVQESNGMLYIANGQKGLTLINLVSEQRSSIPVNGYASLLGLGTNLVVVGSAEGGITVNPGDL